MDLQAAVDDVSVSTIVLAAAGSPFMLTTELYITRDVTLIGEINSSSERVTLDASLAKPEVRRRILHVAAGAVVSMQLLSLTGASVQKGSDAGGGAVLNAGTLRMDDCTIFGNRAYSGAAIMNRGKLVLQRCVVAANNAVTGAVFAYAGSTDVKDCVFEENSAYAGAGLVSFAPTWVSDSTFRRNHATEGGAVFNADQLLMEGCKVVDNDAKNVGGGIMNAGLFARLILRDSAVTNNSAVHKGGGLLVTEGDLKEGENTSSAVEVVNVSISGNHALQGAGVFNSGTLTLNATDVIGNNAKDSWLQNASKFEHEFEHEFEGSALYNTGSALLVDRSRLSIGDVRGGNVQALQFTMLYNGGKLLYLLPAPLGFYLDSVFQCKTLKCEKAGSSVKVDCDVQPPCNRQRYEDKFMATAPMGELQWINFPFLCERGYYGNSYAVEDQSSFACRGRCPPGKYCPGKALTNPMPCPVGHTCAGGVEEKCGIGTFPTSSNTTCEASSPCTDNAHLLPHQQEKKCECNLGFFPLAGSGEELQCAAEMPYLVLWGLPGWVTLVLPIVLVFLRRRRTKRHGNRAGAVYAALRAVDVKEGKRRVKAGEIDVRSATGLRWMARAILAASVPTFPLLPCLVAIYVFTPYATMRLADGSFPLQLRRQRASREASNPRRPLPVLIADLADLSAHRPSPPSHTSHRRVPSSRGPISTMAHRVRLRSYEWHALALDLRAVQHFLQQRMHPPRLYAT